MCCARQSRRRAVRRRVFAAFGRAGQQQINGVGKRFDVAVFFGGDAGNHIVKRTKFLAPAKVERLKCVVHQRGHFAETSAEQFLYSGGIIR